MLFSDRTDAIFGPISCLSFSLLAAIFGPISCLSFSLLAVIFGPISDAVVGGLSLTSDADEIRDLAFCVFVFRDFFSRSPCDVFTTDDEEESTDEEESKDEESEVMEVVEVSGEDEVDVDEQ